MEEQTKQAEQNNKNITISPKNWLKIEQENLISTKFDGEILPALKLEEGKIVTFMVDFSKEFGKWTDGTVIKKIVPVTHKEEKKNLWLNVKNPLYKQIVDKGINGQTVFKVSTVGHAQDTRYTIVEEE